MKLSVRIKELREDRGLSLLQLSKVIGVADTTIGRGESCKRIPMPKALLF